MAIVIVDPPPETLPPLPDPAVGATALEALNGGAVPESLESMRRPAEEAGDRELSLPPAMTAAEVAGDEPAGASFATGVPLDFVFFARQKYPDDDEETAVANLLRDIEAPLPAVALESVVAAEVVEGASLYTHPCLYADPEAIDDLERIPGPWLARINQHRAHVERILRAVGRIQLHHYVPRGITPTGQEVGLVAGTGVVIAPGVIMTNRHVAELFAMAREPDYPFLKDGRGEHEPVVLIDFGGVYDEQQNVHRIGRVLYIAREDEPDVALLELRESPGREAPLPAPLQLTEPDTSAFPRDAVVVGYPSIDRADARVPRFFRLLRVKRVSLGQIQRPGRWGGMTRLFHNCTTLGGSSGSPLVDLESGSIWGLHFQGHAQAAGVEGNLAEPMWRLAELPAVRQVLENAGVSAPASRAVLESLMAAPAPPTPAARPVLFVEGDDLDADQPFPSEWFAAGGAAHQHVRDGLPSVGAVQSRDKTGAVVSATTGFLVGPDLLLTFPMPWQKPLKRNKKQGIFVDFARTIANEPPRSFRASAELYRDDYVWMLRLEPTPNHPLPDPLPLMRTRPAGAPLADETVFVVGHPAAAGGGASDSAAMARVFPPPYGVKRVALGLLREEAPDARQFADCDVWHDCSTTGGDGGAPIFSLATGEVLGMHLGGAFQRGNFGISMWSLLAKPEIGALLAPSTTP